MSQRRLPLVARHAAPAVYRSNPLTGTPTKKKSSWGAALLWFAEAGGLKLDLNLFPQERVYFVGFWAQPEEWFHASTGDSGDNSCLR
jgi:hypothetical protein